MLRAGAALLVISAGVLSACGTDARGVDACRRIEEVRCRRASACGVDLSFIKYVGKSDSDAIEGCVRYYHTACMHGLVAEEPGAGDIQNCVSAIQTGSCDTVRTPESSAACVWLVPKTPAPADAAAAAPADGGTDANP